MFGVVLFFEAVLLVAVTFLVTSIFFSLFFLVDAPAGAFFLVVALVLPVGCLPKAESTGAPELLPFRESDLNERKAGAQDY